MKPIRRAEAYGCQWCGDTFESQDEYQKHYDEIVKRVLANDVPMELIQNLKEVSMVKESNTPDLIIDEDGGSINLDKKTLIEQALEDEPKVDEEDELGEDDKEMEDLISSMVGKEDKLIEKDMEEAWCACDKTEGCECAEDKNVLEIKDEKYIKTQMKNEGKEMSKEFWNQYMDNMTDMADNMPEQKAEWLGEVYECPACKIKLELYMKDGKVIDGVECAKDCQFESVELLDNHIMKVHNIAIVREPEFNAERVG